MFRIDDPIFKLEADLIGPEGVPIDAKFKFKYARVKDGPYVSPLDPYDIEVSITNNLAGRIKSTSIISATEMRCK